VERRIRRIVKVIADDDAPIRSLKQELVTLEERHLRLQHELAATEAPAPLIHANLAEVYRQRVERLYDALQDAGTRDEAFELIRSLIDEIRLVPEDGKLQWNCAVNSMGSWLWLQTENARRPLGCRACRAN
jgi:hypothetical protein